MVNKEFIRQWVDGLRDEIIKPVLRGDGTWLSLNTKCGCAVGAGMMVLHSKFDIPLETHAGDQYYPSSMGFGELTGILDYSFFSKLFVVEGWTFAQIADYLEKTYLQEEGVQNDTREENRDSRTLVQTV